jgi:pimeloyl-ACP methyl ester carboxylesterase
VTRVIEPSSGLSLHLDDSGSGLPVVFQHGLCGDANQPAEVFPSGYRRLTLECRGHGRSQAGSLEAFSLATFADDVAAMIEESGLAPLVVGGISMGAAIALRLAVKRPDLVRGLIIARPAWAMEAAPSNMAPNAEVGDLLSRLSLEQARAVFEASDTARRLSEEAPDNLASLRGFFSRAPQAVTAALLTRISADGPGVSESELAGLRVPALVIGHAKDAIHPLAMAKRLATLIPDARLMEITPKAVDKARYVAEFRAALHDFLKDFT